MTRDGSSLAAALVGAILAVLLSGCSNGGGKPDINAIELQEVDNSLTQGSISGVVVDEAIRVIPGANVSLLGKQRSTLTDEDGLFVFDALDPGLYTLSVAPIPDGERRFFGIQTTADVVAGQTAKVRIVMPTDTTVQPYSVTLTFDGFFQVGSGYIDEVLTLAVYNQTVGPVTTPSPTCTCLWGFSSDDQVQTFVVDLTFEESVERPAPQFWAFLLEAQGENNDIWFCYEAPPCNAHIPGANFTPEARNFTVEVWSDPIWVTVNQPFQLFVTMFYAAPAPEGWSFLDQPP